MISKNGTTRLSRPRKENVVPDKVLGETSGEQVEPNNDNLDIVHRVRFWNKPQMLELLARHLRLLDDAPIQPGALRVPLFTLPDGDLGAQRAPCGD
jgi:hypothetical protein